ncbi:MAG: AMP-binding protein [Planctomycetota bacterium]
MNQTTTSAPVSPQRAVLEAVHELVAELHPGRRVAVHPHSHLERDLGLDSLARVELLARLERELGGLRVSERAAAAAERVEDLVAAVAAARPQDARRPGERVEMPLALVDALPTQAETLVEVLRWHAERAPDRVQIWLIDDDDAVSELSFGALWDLSQQVARGLVEQGIEPGQSVAMMLPTGRDFLAGFFGVLAAGGIPVPIYPPVRPSQVEEHLRRQAGVLRTAGCPLLITVDEAKRLGLFLRSQVPCLRGLVTVAELTTHGPLERPVPLRGEDTAFLQFTSGSTADPKGVVLSHRNLLANMRAIGEFVDPVPEDVFVSWLPLYHDMGLIGAVLTTLYHAVPLVLMSPLAFLLRPERWLWAMHRHRGTLSAAPNFAYELCAKKIPAEALQGLDLSAWRMTLNGAEPISPQACARFADRFAEYGYRPEAMTPTFGLAECSLALAMTPLPRLPRVDRVRREFARTGQATPAAPGEDALEFVSCGAPLRGHELKIVDEGGRELGERREGRLWFRGPSATAGYFRNEEATARLVRGGGWLDSGDLAYVAEGEVYLTGRIKDVIIRAGRNVYPHELEELVGELEGVRKGCVAVFGARDHETGTEELVVLAETRETEADRRAALEERIRAATLDLLGTPPERVVLAPPHTVLKTSSGKIRRAACRALYEDGRLLASSGSPAWQLARLTLTGWAFAARQRARRAAEAAWAAKFWGAFVPAYGAAWALSAALPALATRWQGARACSRAFLWVAGVDVSVAGREHLAPDGGQVLVANHASYLDGVLVPLILPRPTSVVVKKELQASPITRVLLERLEAIFVERFSGGASAADAAQVPAALREGRAVLVFPEGTCLRMPGLLPFHLGAFQAAAEAGAPVLPVTIRGTRNVLRPESWFPFRGRVEVEIGAPLAPAGRGFQDALALRDQARAAILAAVREPDLAGEDARVHVVSD